MHDWSFYVIEGVKYVALGAVTLVILGLIFNRGKSSD